MPFLGPHCSLMALPGVSRSTADLSFCCISPVWAVALALLVTPTPCHPKVSIKCPPCVRHRVTGGQWTRQPRPLWVCCLQAYQQKQAITSHLRSLRSGLRPAQMSGLPATSVVDCSRFHCRCFSGLLPRPPPDSPLLVWSCFIGLQPPSIWLLPVCALCNPPASN